MERFSFNVKHENDYHYVIKNVITSHFYNFPEKKWDGNIFT